MRVDCCNQAITLIGSSERRLPLPFSEPSALLYMEKTVFSRRLPRSNLLWLRFQRLMSTRPCASINAAFGSSAPTISTPLKSH
jgi:hypothetical protein